MIYIYLYEKKTESRCLDPTLDLFLYLRVVVVHEVQVDPQLPHTLESVFEPQAETEGAHVTDTNASSVLPILQDDECRQEKT